MAYQYNPPPGPPLNPSEYTVIGPNGIKYGQQPNFQYNPVTDQYDPIPKKEDKPSAWDTLGPVAAGAGAIAGGTYLGSQAFKPETWSWLGGSGGASTASGAGAGAGAATGAASAGSAAAGAAPSTPVVTGASLTPNAAPFSMFGPGGAVPTAAGIAAGAYTGYQQATGVADALKGEDLDFQQQAALALPTFGMSFLYNPVKDQFGSGKDKAQLKRDAVRKDLQERGLLDEQFNIYNADGSAFNLGFDGGAMLEGGAYDGKRHYYDVNHDDPAQVALIPIADAFSAIITGGDKKLTSDFAGYFINAATSSGDARENIISYMNKVGLDHAKAYGTIHLLAEEGKLDTETANSYKNSLDAFFKKGHYASAGGSKPLPSTTTPGPSKAVSSPAPSPAPAPAPMPAQKPQQAAPQPEQPKKPSGLMSFGVGTRAK